MVFFKKNKKNLDNEVSMLLDKTSIVKNYKNLYEALAGEVNIGTQDDKITTLFYDDKNVVIYTSNANIINVVDPDHTFDLKSRLKYSNITLEDYNVIRELGLEKYTTNDDYVLLTERLPHLKEILQKIFKENALANLTKIEDEFSEIRDFYTEILHGNSNQEVLQKTDFLLEPITTLKATIREREKKELLGLMLIGASKVEQQDEISFAIRDDNNYTPETDNERYLHKSIENFRNLQQIQDNSAGFNFAELLNVLSTLREKGVIEIILPFGKMVETTLPQIVDDSELMLQNGQVKEYSSLLEKAENAGVRIDSVPLKNAYDDDVNPTIKENIIETVEESTTFEEAPSLVEDNDMPVEEATPLVEDNDTPVEESTSFIEWESNLEDLILNEENFNNDFDEDNLTKTFVLNNNTIEETEKLKEIFEKLVEENKIEDTIITNIENNYELEKKLLELEEKISIETSYYNNNITEYEKLKFNHELEQIKDFEEDSERVSIDQIEGVTEIRNNSHSNFFNLLKLEEERYEYNIEREELLYDSIEKLNNSNIDDSETLEIQKIIDKKLEEISRVSNYVFTPKVTNDDTGEVVTDETVEDTHDSDINPIFEIEVGASDYSPIYNELVQSMNFDPLLEQVN